MARYQAPPVSYPVGPCLFYRRLLLLSWLAGAVGLWVWALEAGAVPWVGLTGLVVSGAVGMLAWRRSPTGRLAWAPGAGWSWQEGAVHVCDLQAPRVAWRGHGHLLLNFAHAQGSIRWLWLERWRDPTCWDAVCRASQST